MDVYLTEVLKCEEDVDARCGPRPQISDLERP